MIEITLLGTAALLPIPGRALTAATLFCSGHSILFDCGEGTQTAARRAGVSLMKTDMIALTHYHGDHIFGLPGLLQTMTAMQRTEPLYITGPVHLRNVMEPILELTGWTSYPINLVEISEDGLRLCDLIKGWPYEAKLRPFPTVHRVPSQGYCFTLGRAPKFQPEKARELEIPVRLWGNLQRGESVCLGDRVILPKQVLGDARKGLKFIFSGDTAACDSLVNAAREADLMICEGTYGENGQTEAAAEYGHMTFAKAAEMAARANVKTLWLTHYSQQIEDPKMYLPNAAAVFKNTFCGKDGMRTVLHFESD